MLTESERHIVICNWNAGGDRVVRELHSSDAEPDTEIVVATDKELNEEELRKNPAYGNVYFVRGDPTLHYVLQAARVAAAKSIIILADEESPGADARSALIALAITRLCGTAKPHIVAQAFNHRLVQHLQDAGADEIVCAADYGLGLLAQCALHAKLSAVYDDLLSYAEGSNEIYIVEGARFPKCLIGKSFDEAAEILNRNRTWENPVILLGMRRGDKFLLNPRRDRRTAPGERFDRIEEGDALLVMAYQMPDLSGLCVPCEAGATATG